VILTHSKTSNIVYTPTVQGECYSDALIINQSNNNMIHFEIGQYQDFNLEAYNLLFIISHHNNQ